MPAPNAVRHRKPPPHRPAGRVKSAIAPRHRPPQCRELSAMVSLRVLILGGSSEASGLVRALAGDARFAAQLSLAGRTAAPALPTGDYRIGGFGGVAGLAAH